MIHYDTDRTTSNWRDEAPESLHGMVSHSMRAIQSPTFVKISDAEILLCFAACLNSQMWINSYSDSPETCTEKHLMNISYIIPHLLCMV